MSDENKWGRAQLMVIAAVRYCLGRSSYIVSDCVDWLISQWSEFDHSTKAIVQRDIEEAFLPVTTMTGIGEAAIRLLVMTVTGPSGRELGLCGFTDTSRGA